MDYIKIIVMLQSTDLNLVFKDSSPSIPLVFVLSQGTDPAADLYKFAEEMRFSKKLSAISLGQGQVGREGICRLGEGKDAGRGRKEGRGMMEGGKEYKGREDNSVQGEENKGRRI